MDLGICSPNTNYTIDINYADYIYPMVDVARVTWDVYVKCVAMALIVLVALIGNVLIIIIVSSSGAMRTTTNIYIMNLAVADLIIACFPTWIFLVKDITKYWAAMAFLCKFNPFIQIQAMCTMSFTMIAIASDRFFAVVYPLKARVTHSKVEYILVIVWAAAVAVAIPPLLYYTYSERQWANYLEQFCVTIWPMFVMPNGECDLGKTSEKLYYVFVLSALNWVPMAAMTVSYVIIIYRLQWGQKSGSLSQNVPVAQRRSSKKVVKLLFVLLLAFIVCTVPFQVVSVYSMTKDPMVQLPYWFQPVYYAALNLMYAHSCVNPLVYGAMSQSFRTGFQHLSTRSLGSKRKRMSK